MKTKHEKAIEAAARAMWNARNDYLHRVIANDSHFGRAVVTPWEAAGAFMQGVYREIAEATIKAYREEKRISLESLLAETPTGNA